PADGCGGVETPYSDPRSSRARPGSPARTRGASAVHRPGRHATSADLDDERLLKLPPVPLADVALLAREHHHSLLGDDLVDRDLLAGVVGLDLEEQVQPVGA